MCSRGVAFLSLMFLAVGYGDGATRVYFLGIREEEWDYAPGHMKLNEDSSVFLEHGPDRVGSIYKKAVFRQYTDSSYSSEIPKPSWLGFLGPVIRAEVNDVIQVNLMNFASRNYSIHPHGVFYEKHSEGAWYPDNTTDALKADDAVPPGQSHSYTWIVKPEFAPADGDPQCLTWAYHSHVDAPKDISSGLIGALLTCKRGVLLDSKNMRSDVDQDFFFMFSIMDENLSWYLEENISKFCSESSKVDRFEESFQKSNKMHFFLSIAINGFVFGTLPDVSLCVGQPVSWHLFGMGNEVDIHSANFRGHTVLEQGHRSDVISLFPASFATAKMVPSTTGRWLLSCQVNDHLKAGMWGFFNVSLCGSRPDIQIESSGRERHYYISAEEEEWNYAPYGVNRKTNIPLTAPDSDSAVFFNRENGHLGGKYWKVRYVAYTDHTFTKRQGLHSSEEYLGILGPIIRAEAGDVVVVTFLNNATETFSIQPHGLQYEKQYEGALYYDGSITSADSVGPGERFTYRWKVLEGPSLSDPACLSYLYYSSHDPLRDTTSGLIGPLQVCKRGALDDSGMQSEVDREFFLFFSVIDENLSFYLDKNIESFGNEESKVHDEEFIESNKMHAVNGYVYGNLPGLDLCEGEHVVWHMLAAGTEVDIHGIYFQGNTFRRHNTTRDVLSLFPHTTATVDMTPDNVGVFGVSCRTFDHFLAGMWQLYTVKPCSSSLHQQPVIKQPVVQFFLSAEEVEWDYAPSRDWETEKHRTTKEDSPGDVFLKKTDRFIGSRYKKVVFQEYTDATFTLQKKRTRRDEHLGILGPILRVQVGEEIQITFRNNASHLYSIHAHGVQHFHHNQSAVSPGSAKEYIWKIPERSGPGPSDPNCITFAYYSIANYVKDLASGLVGPLVVCRPGTLNKDRLRMDVERDFALLFMVFDENDSWYLQENIDANLHSVKDIGDPDFMESNLMHAINGRLYGTLSGLEMVQGERVEWYLLGLGNEVDMHTVHFHALSFVYKTDRTHTADVFDLFPGTFQTVSMTAGNPGTWLLHCHVSDHVHAGMETTFVIFTKAAPAKTSVTSIGFVLLLLLYVLLEGFQV
ncbi:hephaestin-like protein 1 isoform X3 [Denticeps clupeoides]|uniref:hephaestin-like protein 1 isoform X3 n=1 Tax=Denticeps clupeoides TaxID=299321 RepID=UPI0010A53B4C|nr:hephaestin-like protein 1 isoform X3 [Denticeps clupeoides]